MSTFNSADIAAFTGGVWVFCEQRQGKMMSTSYELISEGRKLADERGTKLYGLLLGDGIEGIAKELGAFTGDGTDPAVFTAAARAIGASGGKGIPTVKPWDRNTLFSKLDEAKAAGAQVIAMDIDAAGLPFLKGLQPPAGSKTVAELREIVEYAEVPFLIKGVMTVKGARKALEAGAAGIVVSNHGGRVLDGVPATAEVLPAIADAVRDQMVILVDGGIRSGVDVCKALALGADAVLLARPYVTAVYGGGAEGVALLTQKLKGELEDTMAMCGVHSLKEITREILF